jgi:hypothetical protein
LVEIISGKVVDLIFFVLLWGLAYIFMQTAKSGSFRPKVRRLEPMNGIDEAIGRATEMGRSVHYGLGGRLEGYYAPQTVASASILSYVAEQCAEQDTRLIVTVHDSQVLPFVNDVVSQACIAAGKPEQYDINDVRMLTTGNAYASGVMNILTTEKVAASMYLGTIYSECLLVAETGNYVGAITIAGTGRAIQIPWMAAMNDYCLICDELFAAGAYVTEDPEMAGTFASEDLFKFISVGLMIIGAILATVGNTSLAGILGM